MPKILLTGIKPTGAPHLGNYTGAIQQTCAMAQTPGLRSFLLIADGHALNSVRDPARLRRHTDEIAATYAAMGLATEQNLLFRQSDLQEIYQLAGILACYCPKGMANRAHAYKAAVAANMDSGCADIDAGINMGLFTYPILMSADILAFDTDVVPVGADQKQHVELTIALARRINNAVGTVLRVPTLRIDPSTHTMPGLDGRKMSKSYGNTIPLFSSRDQLRKLVFRIQTDSRAKGEPGDASTCALFGIFSVFANEVEIAALLRDYEGGVGYAMIKERVFETIDKFMSEPRERYAHFLGDRDALDTTLEHGAELARQAAQPVLARVKAAVGLG